MLRVDITFLLGRYLHHSPGTWHAMQLRVSGGQVQWCGKLYYKWSWQRFWHLDSILILVRFNLFSKKRLSFVRWRMFSQFLGWAICIQACVRADGGASDKTTSNSEVLWKYFQQNPHNFFDCSGKEKLCFKRDRPATAVEGRDRFAWLTRRAQEAFWHCHEAPWGRRLHCCFHTQFRRATPSRWVQPDEEAGIGLAEGGGRLEVASGWELGGFGGSSGEKGDEAAGKGVGSVPLMGGKPGELLALIKNSNRIKWQKE